MIETLLKVEKNLEQLLQSSKLNSMYIDYHKPFVKRIWFQMEQYRVYLHCIEPCNESSEALYHPHPWKSAIRIISGKYEMGIGHSSTNETPKTDCKLILPADTLYEMTEPDSWHYVNPIGGNIYSLMVTGEKNNRPMPVEPKKEFRKLTEKECINIFIQFSEYYEIYLSPDKILQLAKFISQ